MEKFRYISNVEIAQADLYTPVSLYLRLRDHFSKSFLMESSDHHSSENAMSFLGFDALAEINVREGKALVRHGAKHFEEDAGNAQTVLQAFTDSFSLETKTKGASLFGYCSFEAIQHFETITLSNENEHPVDEIAYAFFRFVIIIDHFRDEMQLIEHIPEGQNSQMESFKNKIKSRKYSAYDFKCLGAVTSNIDDQRFMDSVTAAKAYCQSGDIFQVVLSRRFKQKFEGDEFNVYRALRSINPSPYLFFFDFGSYKIFGSSPEAQLIVEEDIATVNPIAGTYKRTGDDAADRKAAKRLSADPKEKSEHVMLVDLARNDLSRSTAEVEVIKQEEIQFFSHVIHLVSKVSGKIKPGRSAIDVFGDTFPAGTLSGAPKIRALQIIDEMEVVKRGIYGGAIGMLSLTGNVNHAIIIRSFLSINQTLIFQAGAGIVVSSDAESELNEVNNKLGALNAALKRAEKI